MAAGRSRIRCDCGWSTGWSPDRASLTMARWDSRMQRVRLWIHHLSCSTCPPSHSGDVPTEACRRCGGPNVAWSAASPLWNYVMRGNDINGTPLFDDLVCMPCFVRLAVDAGLPTHGWRLTLHPEPDGLIYETPSGRVWDEGSFLWGGPEGAPF